MSERSDVRGDALDDAVEQALSDHHLANELDVDLRLCPLGAQGESAAVARASG